MKKLIPLIVLIICAASFLAGRCSRSVTVIPASECKVIDSITTEDTVADLAPALAVKDSVVVRHQYKVIPLTPPPETSDSVTVIDSNPEDIAIVECGDSAEVVIPITQKKYETEDYRAYVSGYCATLDSVFINRPTTTIRIRESTRQKHFSVGFQAGYGMTPKGFQPYLGIGISATLFAF